MGARPKTVLVVDDQEDERTIQRAMLAHLGYTVVEARDGQSALRAARESHPDLVLLDVAMPHMDGFEVARALRPDPSTANTRILLFTASVIGDLEELAAGCGADGVLAKPIDPHRVGEEVAKLIGEA